MLLIVGNILQDSVFGKERKAHERLETIFLQNLGVHLLIPKVADGLDEFEVRQDILGKFLLNNNVFLVLDKLTSQQKVDRIFDGLLIYCPKLTNQVASDSLGSFNRWIAGKNRVDFLFADLCDASVQRLNAHIADCACFFVGTAWTVFWSVNFSQMMLDLLPSFLLLFGESFLLDWTWHWGLGGCRSKVRLIPNLNKLIFTVLALKTVRRRRIKC